MHKAWSQLGTFIDPESKPGSCESTFRNFSAFVQPLCAFFEIGDGVMSKFHDAAAFNTATDLYYDALEAHIKLTCTRERLALKGPWDATVAAGGSEVADPSLIISDSEKAAESIKRNCLGAVVPLVGTLQYIPGSCSVDLIPQTRVTRGYDK